jgi:pimeloyl-ACP methyl ester carboxylesterase
MKWFKTVSATVLMAMTCVACGSDAPSDPAAKGKTFLLVHGAWMGAWCWTDVANALRAQGATVDTVELPAHGNDMTALADATLDAYVAKVTAALDTETTPVILVGHSMAGMVITGAAEAAPEKIEKLVYLGAYLPKDGQSLFDLAMTDTDSHLGQVSVVDQEAGLVSIPAESLKDVFLADGSDAEVAELKSRYRDEPLVPFVTPVHTTVENWGSVSKVYIYTKQDHAVSYALQQRMTQGVTLAGSEELDTSHSPFLSQPALTASTLAAL